MRRDNHSRWPASKTAHRTAHDRDRAVTLLGCEIVEERTRGAMSMDFPQRADVLQEAGSLLDRPRRPHGRSERTKPIECTLPWQISRTQVLCSNSHGAEGIAHAAREQ
jgi:hypothetical protein